MCDDEHLQDFCAGIASRTPTSLLFGLAPFELPASERPVVLRALEDKDPQLLVTYTASRNAKHAEQWVKLDEYEQQIKARNESGQREPGDLSIEELRSFRLDDADDADARYSGGQRLRLALGEGSAEKTLAEGSAEKVASALKKLKAWVDYGMQSNLPEKIDPWPPSPPAPLPDDSVGGWFMRIAPKWLTGTLPGEDADAPLGTTSPALLAQWAVGRLVGQRGPVELPRGGDSGSADALLPFALPSPTALAATPHLKALLDDGDEPTEAAVRAALTPAPPPATTAGEVLAAFEDDFALSARAPPAPTTRAAGSRSRTRCAGCRPRPHGHPAAVAATPEHAAARCKQLAEATADDADGGAKRRGSRRACARRCRRRRRRSSCGRWRRSTRRASRRPTASARHGAARAPGLGDAARARVRGGLRFRPSRGSRRPRLPRDDAGQAMGDAAEAQWRLAAPECDRARHRRARGRALDGRLRGARPARAGGGARGAARAHGHGPRSRRTPRV